jgi:hypothetical protein
MKEHSKPRLHEAMMEPLVKEQKGLRDWKEKDVWMRTQNYLKRIQSSYFVHGLSWQNKQKGEALRY